MTRKSTSNRWGALTTESAKVVPPRFQAFCHDGRPLGLPFSIKSAETGFFSAERVVRLSIAYARPPGRVRGQKLRLLFIDPEELDVGDWRVQ